MKLHRAAWDNLKEWCRRVGVSSLTESDIEPVDPKPHRFDHKHIVNCERPGIDDSYKVSIAGQRFGLAFCRLVYKQYCDGMSQDILAATYDLPKMIVHSIIQKGIHGKLRQQFQKHRK